MGRILVTGGAGFIGSHLVERLVAAGEDVVVLDDLSRGRREWLPTGTELHVLDVRNGTALPQLLAEISAETVVHLAALHYIPAVEDAPKLASEINVIGTKVLLNALGTTPPKLFLFASSAAVYPDRPGPIAESCAPGPIDLYGRTKLEGERMVAQFAEETGAKAIVARIFNVIGARETNPHVVPDVIGQLRRGELPLRIGNLSARRDYTDVRDAAAALDGLLASADDHGSVFNIGSGRSVSVAELVQECEKIIAQPIERRVEQRRLRVQDRAELVADPRLLRETTGWQPTHSLRDTLAELLSAESENLSRFCSDTK
jgi:UDP-glucose 4-epimerase